MLEVLASIYAPPLTETAHMALSLGDHTELSIVLECTVLNRTLSHGQHEFEPKAHDLEQQIWNDLFTTKIVRSREIAIPENVFVYGKIVLYR